MKIVDLTGSALDYAISKAEGIQVWKDSSNEGVVNGEFLYHFNKDWVRYTPSTDWSQGGPIIDREGILSGPSPFRAELGKFAACVGSNWDEGKFIGTGPTRLVAAMRCYVASKLGDEVEIPKQIMKLPLSVWN